MFFQLKITHWLLILYLYVFIGVVVVDVDRYCCCCKYLNLNNITLFCFPMSDSRSRTWMALFESIFLQSLYLLRKKFSFCDWEYKNQKLSSFSCYPTIRRTNEIVNKKNLKPFSWQNGVHQRTLTSPHISVLRNNNKTKVHKILLGSALLELFEIKIIKNPRKQLNYENL